MKRSLLKVHFSLTESVSSLIWTSCRAIRRAVGRFGLATLQFTTHRQGKVAETPLSTDLLLMVGHQGHQGQRGQRGQRGHVSLPKFDRAMQGGTNAN